MCILQFGATDSCDVKQKHETHPQCRHLPPLLPLSCSLSEVHTPRRLHTPRSLCPFPVALSGNTCLTGINNSIKIYILLFNNLLLLFVNFSLSPSLSIALSLIRCSCWLIFRFVVVFPATRREIPGKAFLRQTQKRSSHSTGNVWWQFTRYLQRGSHRRRQRRRRSWVAWPCNSSLSCLSQRGSRAASLQSAIHVSACRYLWLWLFN